MDAKGHTPEERYRNTVKVYQAILNAGLTTKQNFRQEHQAWTALYHALQEWVDEAKKDPKQAVSRKEECTDAPGAQP
jgi:hypothetical protein